MKSRLIVILAATLLLASCEKAAAPPAYTPTLSSAPARAKLAEYTFAVTPMSNFRDVYDVFQPIMDYMNARLPGARLVLEVPRGLDEHDHQLAARRFAFALSNPWHTWRAAQTGGYTIFGKFSDNENFRGIWIVRKDSGIKSLTDLKGKKICFPPKSALAATMMTRMQLRENGVDPLRDVSVTYVGSQHASIMEVYTKGAVAGATWPLAWINFQRLNPEESKELEARFPTTSLINQGLVARNDVPPELVRHVAELLQGMDQTPEGRALLKAVPVRRFEPAGTADYEVVHTFMEKYKKAFPAD
ncbi:MAG: phosphate/phosphite/phosphonate ABC transporter substrate-binding protein [Pseudomonadota bacterium]